MDNEGLDSAVYGVIRTPGAISTPEDMVATKEGTLDVTRRGDTGAVTEEEGEIGDTP